MGKKFYISDLHLGHKNIIRMSKRPFSSVEEMDATLINNWNSVVTDEDDIYIVGDFCYKSGKDPKEYLEKLKGKKHLIIGNHDSIIVKNPVLRKYFTEIRDKLIVNDQGKMIVLSHYPMVEWEGFFRGSIHFYGHVHNNTQNATYDILLKIPNAYNVGADILNFYPREFNEVIKYNDLFNKSIQK